MTSERADTRVEEYGAQERHVPVMLQRCTEVLLPALVGDEVAHGPAVHVDGTLGMGGHAEAILEAAPQAVVIGIDRDEDALAIAGRRLARFGDRFRPVHAVYSEIAEVVSAEGFGHASSVLLDLGVSSLQLDEVERGFAYRTDAPLDMRMDASTGPTAADLLNTADAGELTAVLRDYGEERFAARIARRIVAERERAPFDRSGRLVELLTDVIPAASQRRGGHPAKRTFQALRIAVNAELDALAAALPAALTTLAVGGRVAVLSYHSLEDRMVKQVFAAASRSSAPEDLPVVPPEHTATHRLLTRGAETPSENEIERNPRAASARLRAAMRVREGQRPGVLDVTPTGSRQAGNAGRSHRSRGPRRSKGRTR